jgi:hypothetical protein
MRKFVVFLLFATILAFGGAARATVFGSVRGVVHDPQHRPIEGAEIKLQAAASDWSMTTISDVNGEFTFNPVAIGEFKVMVHHTGFDDSQQSITIASGTSPVLHFELGIGTISQTVTVTDQGPVTGIDSVTPTTILSREDIAKTPGADRSNSLLMITDYVPGAYFTHDQLHVRGGHQVSWLLDGVPIPNTNIASNLGPQIDPKDVDYLEAQRGSYEAAYGDRTYATFDLVPRSGFERNNEAELVTSFGNWYQTNDQINFGGHTERFAYFASVNGNRSNLGLETPVGQVVHNAENGYGGFASLMYNADSKDQFRFVTSLRKDYYQIPYDPDPNDAENQQVNTSALRDGQHESDAVVNFSWVRTINPNTILTVSPFYHYNTADYDGAPDDFPVSTTDHRSSKYGGLQATYATTFARNSIQIGVYGFGQRDDQFFGALFNDASNDNLADREITSGGLVAAFIDDKFKVTRWLTLTAGIRPTHFSGGISEGAVSPRFGVAFQVPHLNWVFRAFYGQYYQAPPLDSIAGPLVNYESAFSGVPTVFLPLRGERDEEHQFGVTIPYRDWTLDADTFQTRARNFFDHNNVGESDIFIPVTIDGALIQAWELTLRSPRLWNRARLHLAYSNQLAKARGAITGGLICFPPTSLLCEPADQDYSPLDHDQRNTLSAGWETSLPWQTYASANVYYGSGFTNGNPPPHYLPQHTTVDISLGRSFGEKYSVAVTGLNVGNRHLLIDNSLTFGGFHYNDPREIYVEFRYKFHY